MDEWVPEECCRRVGDGAQLPQAEFTNRKRKRKRDVNYSLEPSALNGFSLRGVYAKDKGSQMPTEIVMTEEDFDLQHHQQLRAQRNFDVVIFDVWKIKPW
jgi:histone acetyltransferase MYST1